MRPPRRGLSRGWRWSSSGMLHESMRQHEVHVESCRHSPACPLRSGLLVSAFWWGLHEIKVTWEDPMEGTVEASAEHSEPLVDLLSQSMYRRTTCAPPPTWSPCIPCWRWASSSRCCHPSCT